MYVLNAYCAADSNFELASNRGAGHILVVRKKCCGEFRESGSTHRLERISDQDFVHDQPG